MRKNTILKSSKRRGQTSVEYILIIAAAVAVIFIFKDKFKTGIGTATEKLFGSVTSGVSDLSGQK